MLKNYLLTTIRFLKRNKLYSLINITGLTLGLTCSIVIFLIIQFELSFDKIPEGDRVFRVVNELITNDNPSFSSGIPYPLPHALQNEFSNIEKLTLVDANFGSPVISITNEDGSVDKFLAEHAVYVEKDFFEMFPYQYLAGDPAITFDDPNSVVLSESLAKKYFGSIDVVGKTLLYNNDELLQVKGVVNNPRKNSSLSFTFFRLFPEERRGTNWSSFSSAVQCFIKLNSAANENLINNGFNDFEKKYLLEEDYGNLHFFLQPLEEIHYDDRYYNFGQAITSKQILLALGIIAALILLISSINYINLSTALGLNRAAEVGIRKVFGSSRLELAFRFLAESTIITFIAFALALIAVQFSLPFFNSTFGFNADIAYLNPLAITGYLTAAFILMSLISGFYPAIFVSRFNPIKAIKNSVELKSNKKLSLRRVLVIFQFGISQALLIATLVVVSQMNYFENAELGFKKESILEIPIGDGDESNLSTLKSKLEAESFVSSVTYSNTGTSSSNVWSGSFKLTEEDETVEGSIQIKFVDEDFIKTYGLEILAGKDFSQETQTMQYIVNEAFADLVGNGNDFNKLLGKQLEVWNQSGTVVAIIKDFVTTSLHGKIQPVALCFNRDIFQQAAVKLNSSNYNNAIAKINEHWSVIWPNEVFEFEFLDESIKEQYEQEQNLSNVLSMFSFIALIIGCLGLFGLASFIVERRVKEIGIRKVLGANVLSILALFNKEFFFMLLFGFIFFAPASYYFMNKWLENFAYRIEISPFVFIITFTATAFIALATISARAMKAALINPAKALKYE